MMKKGFLLGLAVAGILIAGCSGGDDDTVPSAPVAPAGSAEVGGVAPTPTPSGAPEPGQTTAPATAEAVEPQLVPIQIAIQSFEQQNKRMPMTVKEMVDAGILKDVPPPPAGKLYFIDQATKKVRLGSDP